MANEKTRIIFWETTVKNENRLLAFIIAFIFSIAVIYNFMAGLW